jgi:hypothetical protein
MKNFYTLLFFLLATVSILAQAPEKMSYQAVLRDASNTLLTNQEVGMQISILQSTATGTAVYVETQTVTSNINGLVTLEIGTGSVVSGDFTTIDWSTDNYFIKTETDPAGGTTYTITGTSQLMSVPFAMYAKTSGNAAPGPQGAQGTQGIQGAIGIAGTNGTNGAKGDVGEKGIQGIQGATGADGVSGSIGATGTAGTNGTNGAKGDVGAKGIQGIQGATGADGVSGSIGATGTAGTNGTNGAKGDVGAKGIQGIQGATGADGASGAIGATGADGVSGATGAAGTTGATGIQGAIGTTGTNGTNGAKGDVGEKGEAGVAGTQGIQGAIGTTGTNGTNGAKGDVGENGIQGTQGATGTGGASGETGAQGETGATGVQGPAGVGIAQTLSFTSPNLELSNNGGSIDITGLINDADSDSSNELQSLEEVLNQGNNAAAQLKNVTDPTDAQDATTKAYVDATIDAVIAAALEPAKVGDYRAGGVVFWLNPADNTQGLVCALQDYQDKVQWGCNTTDLPSVPNVAYNNGNPLGSGAEMGDGEPNTAGILADCPDASAAFAARSFGPEWFLPSIQELKEMYENKEDLEAVPGFNSFSNYYWSSTENSNEGAWNQKSSDGSQDDSNKENDKYVRAVRAFSNSSTNGTNTGDQDISGIATNATAISIIETDQITQNTAITDNTNKVGYTDALVSANADVVANSTNTAILNALIADLEARLTALEPEPVAIGDIREGGVVFWVDPADNTHGLVCAFSDYATTVEWGCDDTDLINVPNVPFSDEGPVGLGAEIGDGINNTNNILNDCPSAPAALAARSLGPEWFLPSINELKQMYIHKTILEAVVGFSAFSNYYWSSTEEDIDRAWKQNFYDGYQNSNSKDYTSNVRAVRAF